MGVRKLGPRFVGENFDMRVPGREGPGPSGADHRYAVRADFRVAVEADTAADGAADRAALELQDKCAEVLYVHRGVLGKEIVGGVCRDLLDGRVGEPEAQDGRVDAEVEQLALGLGEGVTIRGPPLAPNEVGRRRAGAALRE